MKKRGWPSCPPGNSQPFATLLLLHYLSYTASRSQTPPQQALCVLYLCVQGREKINLIYTFTQMGYTILVSDVDTVWVRNPIPYMAKVSQPYPAGQAPCHLLTSLGCVVSGMVSVYPEATDSCWY